MPQKKVSPIKTVVVYPGTFDPVTNGHLDIVTRARRLFGSVIIAIGADSPKVLLFSSEERLRLIEEALSESSLSESVRVEIFNGLLVDYLKRLGAKVVIRGLRFISDYEFELQMALINRHLNDEMDTIYMMPDERHIHISSTIVKEIARLGRDPYEFVPRAVVRALRAKYGQSG
ncbi:MAG: pantetheine-phosphate adenylyltransferase [Elusimicrobia bacterium]|nr:pantetheine-phosphate adenylyltransferase [Elusimicrobiota bacterium]